MRVEFIKFPDGDIEGNEGMESLLVDSVEMERFEQANPPAWMTSLREVFAKRDQIAAEAAV